MKGTIRLLVGFILIMGGVGGMETNTTEVLPLDSLGIMIVGILSLSWAVMDIAKESEVY